MTKTQQKDYWTALNGVLEELDGPIRGDRKPPQAASVCWHRQRAGVKFGLTAAMSTQKARVEVKLWVKLRGLNDAKDFWDRLEGQKEAIKKELGFDLHCPPPKRVEAKVSTFLKNVDPEKKSDWPQQHKWIAERLNKMCEVLVPRVEMLIEETQT